MADIFSKLAGAAEGFAYGPQAVRQRQSHELNMEASRQNIETARMERLLKIAKDSGFSRDLRINAMRSAFDTQSGRALLNSTGAEVGPNFAEETIDLMDRQNELGTQFKKAQISATEAGAEASRSRAKYYEQGGARPNAALTPDEKNLVTIEDYINKTANPDLAAVLEEARARNPIFQQRQQKLRAERGQEGLSKLPEQFDGFVAGQKKVKRRKGVFGDKVYGPDAYQGALKKALEAGRQYGLQPDEVQGLFDTWWDRKVQAEAGQKFQKFAPRAGEQAAASAPPSAPEYELVAPREPQSLEEFEQMVRKIADDKDAETYYNKWVHKWQ